MRWAAVILAISALPGFAAERWTLIATPRLEVYTTAGEKKGRETLRRLEQVREFFQKASPVRAPGDFPVRVIEFSTGEQFRPFQPNASTDAFSIPTPRRDYIVLGDIASINYPVAIHEYMHLIVSHSGLKIPLWLNEGWAEVFSTLRPMGNGTAVGDLLEERMKSLETDKWLDFDELTSTTATSPNYDENDRVGIFYAESWALAHMLYLSPEYRDNFGRFLLALNRGDTTAAACQAAFGKSSEMVFHDLQSYLDRKKIYGTLFETAMGDRDSNPQASAVPAFDARLMLAELMVITKRVDEAKKEYARLEKEQPERADVAQAIGTMAFETGDREGARRYFEKAFDEGDADAGMCLELAFLEGYAKQPPARIVTILERAVKSRPDFTEAKIRLGLARADARDFPGAISTLIAIPTVNPDQAPAVFCGLGFAYLETGNTVAARANAEKCRKWAKADADVRVAQQLMKRLGAP